MTSDNKHTREHLTEEQIAVYAEALQRGDLKDVPKDIRDHIAECDQCAAEALTIADILADEEKESTDKKADTKTSKKRYLPYLAIAASIAVLITVFVVQPESDKKDQIAGRNESQTEVETKAEAKAETEAEAEAEAKAEAKAEGENTVKDEAGAETMTEAEKNQVAETKPQETTEETIADKPSENAGNDQENKKEILAANYETDPALEQLVDRYKSGALRGGEIEIKTPSSFEINKGKTAKLEWTNPDNQALLIELYNNQGEKIREKQLSGNSYTLPSDLKAGLYYWKLMNPDFDLLFCGKIMILISD